MNVVPTADSLKWHLALRLCSLWFLWVSLFAFDPTGDTAEELREKSLCDLDEFKFVPLKHKWLWKMTSFVHASAWYNRAAQISHISWYIPHHAPSRGTNLHRAVIMV